MYDMGGHDAVNGQGGGGHGFPGGMHFDIGDFFGGMGGRRSQGGGMGGNDFFNLFQMNFG